MIDAYLVGILSEIKLISCVSNMTLLNHELSSLTNGISYIYIYIYEYMNAV